MMPESSIFRMNDTCIQPPRKLLSLVDMADRSLALKTKLLLDADLTWDGGAEVSSELVSWRGWRLEPVSSPFLSR